MLELALAVLAVWLGCGLVLMLAVVARLWRVGCPLRLREVGPGLAIGAVIWPALVAGVALEWWRERHG